MDSLVASKRVEARWGSLEALAFHLLVEEPEALELGPEAVARVTGLDVGVVAWLLGSSREFRALLDAWIAAGVWDVGSRREAYEVLASRVRSPKERMDHVVKGMEYLDRKVGLVEKESRSPSVAIQIVQEGDGSWKTNGESEYAALEFGGDAHASRERDGRDVEIVMRPDVTERSD